MVCIVGPNGCGKSTLLKSIANLLDYKGNIKLDSKEISKLNRKEIDKVGMSIDVLPTVYNLFGIDYDSRIFAGSDLFSDSEGLVILGNRSWITDKGRYNSITNEYIGTGDNEYINNVNNIVQNKIAFSKGIMINDGYRYIKES